MTKIDITRTELVWPGKYDEEGNLVPPRRVNLPFQVIERVNETRATRQQREDELAGHVGSLFDYWQAQEEQIAGPEDGWRNKLIWGDNLYVMGSLLEHFAGKIDLVYIDPPFATGADFSFSTRIGEHEIVKEQSVIEEKAYRDSWGSGLDSYLQMMYHRLALMHDLLADDGSILVHVDPNVGPYVKLLLADIFGADRCVSEIIWRRIYTHSDARGFGVVHDNIFWYVKSGDYQWNVQYVPHSQSYIESHYAQVDAEGRRYQLISCTAKGSGPPRRFGDSVLAPPPGTHWKWRQETVDQLVGDEKIVFTSGGTPRLKRYLDESPGRVIQSIWTDVFPVNSQAHERVNYDTQKPEALLERIMLACSNKGDLVADFFCGSGTTIAVAEELDRRWIGCDLSRYAIHVARKRLMDKPKCRPFEILNLGKYERQVWQGITFGGKKNTQQMLIFEYLKFILELYGAQPLAGTQHLHGKKGSAMVHVAAVDAPVTVDEINACLAECKAMKQKELHLLGWEWEMGITGLMVEEAKAQGIKLLLLTIPREVMEQQAVDKGDIHFYELAYLEAEVKPSRKKHSVTVELTDFVMPNDELIPPEVRAKIKKWSDYVDYWAVDWDFGNDTFVNGWTSYRTRQDRTLKLKTDPHVYDAPGTYRILVKVIDIFGNDTSQAFEVEVD